VIRPTHMRKKGLTFLVALLFVAVTIGADEPEICFFAAGAGDDPFSRWLHSQTVTCVAPGAAIPAGRWNVFARTLDAISLEPHLVASDETSTPPSLRLAPAAPISLQLPPDHTAVAYATRRVTAFPVHDGDLVPAGEPLLLIVLHRRIPVGSVFVPSIEPGTHRTIDLRDGGRRTLLARAIVPGDHRAALHATNGAMHPRIEVLRDGGSHPIGVLPPPELLHDAIVFAHDVPEGKATIDVGGRGWLPAQWPIAVGPDRMTMVAQPLLLRASATLTVEWSTVNDLPELDARIGSCEDIEPKFSLVIDRCPEPDDDEEERTGWEGLECRMVHSEKLPFEGTVGSATLDEIEPGFYRVALLFGKLPPSQRNVKLAPLQSRPVSIQAVYRVAYGAVTRGGRPLEDDATLLFPDGGTGFATRADREYEAALIRPFETDARIDIETCAGEKMFVFTDTGLGRGRFNIDIPDNRLTIRVIDTFTGEKLPAPRIDYQIMSLRMPHRPILKGKLTSDEDGLFRLESLPERELRFQVSHAGYRKHSVRPFSLTASEVKELDVQLVPLRGQPGKITSAKPFADATIYWHSTRGLMTERVDVEPDGTFFYEGEHTSEETMSVVSSSHPLWVARSPTIERHRQLQIRFPDAAPAASLEIGQGRAMPALSIGGLPVAPGVLRVHLALRDIHRRPEVIPAIAQTGRIEFEETGQ